MGDANKTKLRYIQEATFSLDPGGAYATGVATFTGTGTAADTITVNSVVYTLQNTLAAARDVKIGATAAATAQNFADAINASQSTLGTAFFGATTRNVDVIASVNGAAVTLTARLHGTVGNSLPLAKASTAVTLSGLSSGSTGNLTGGAAGFYTAATELRFNSSGLRHNKVTVQSEEIRADRVVQDLVKVGISGSGDTTHELHYGDLQPFIAAAMQGPVVSLSDSGTWGVTTGGVYTKTTGLLAGMSGGKLIKVSGFVNAVNNGIKRVIAQSGNTFTVVNLDGSAFVAESGVSAIVSVNYVRQGATYSSFIIEQEDVEAATVIALLGCAVDTMTLTLESRAKAMIQFGWLAYGAITPTRTDTVANAINAPSSNPIYNTTANVGNLLINGAKPPSLFRRWTMALKNNLRERPAIAREGTIQHGSGLAEITGAMETYFTEKSTLDAFLQHVAQSVELTMIDTGGRYINVFYPSVQFSSGSPSVQGINTDVMLPLEYQAKRGTGPDGSTFQAQIDMMA